jgi:hypothetical protein
MFLDLLSHLLLRLFYAFIQILKLHLSGFRCVLAPDFLVIHLAWEPVLRLFLFLVTVNVTGNGLLHDAWIGRHESQLRRVKNPFLFLYFGL